MAARRAEKLIFGVVFVWSMVLSAAYSHAAAPLPSEGTAEEIPTPAATEKTETVVPATEGGNLVTEQCCEPGCTCDGVPLCSPPGRYWIRGDWMMWWTSGSNLPPLVTTSPQGTLQNQAGVLGQPGTSILFGDSTVYSDARAGVRITFGGWLDCCHRWGLEADWLTLAGKSINYSATSPTGDPILSRPFYDVFGFTDDQIPDNNQPGESAELVAFKDPQGVIVATGTVSVSGNDSFQSVGMTLRYNLCCSSCGECCAETCNAGCGAECCCDPCCLYYCRTDLLVGFRQYLLGDNLSIHEDIFDIRSKSRFQIADNFNTRNEFYGSEIGLNTELRRGRWSLGLLSKMAFGNNHQTTVINGTTTITNGPDVLNFSEGAFALATNSGVHPRDEFVVIPQLGVEMGYQLTCRCRAYLGYNLIYWSPVMRAGDQIDLNIDPHNFPGGTPLPGGASHFPQYLARESNFWAQGINLGTEIRF